MATQLIDVRETRGQTIAHSGKVKRIDEGFYAVKSQSGNGEYAVFKVDEEWGCECPDNKFRGVKCKHIFAVEFSKSLKAEVEVRHIEPLENLSKCIYCGSENLMRAGKRRNKAGIIQKYLCRNCHKYFTFNIGFERMKHSPQAITTSLQLYFSGESLRNTMKALELMGVKVSYRTVLNWIRKYISILRNYTEKIVPNVSDTWRADEIHMKIAGDIKYVFSMMDDKSRYYISQEVAETKHYHDTKNLFMQAKQLMGKQPQTIITDGLYSYCGAAEVVFDEAKHIRHVRFRGDMNNNKMERMNGEIRDREKTMRGLKTTGTDILKGYQLFHNYFRSHAALNGKTPAEACGIQIEGENKWKTLIQNAGKTASLKSTSAKCSTDGNKER